MSKYRVLREMPGFKVGNYYDAEDMSYFNGVTIRNFKKKHLVEEGWIEEVKENFKSKLMINPDFVQVSRYIVHDSKKAVASEIAYLAKSHYKEKVLRAFDQYAEYSFRERETRMVIRQSIEQAFEE